MYLPGELNSNTFNQSLVLKLPHFFEISRYFVDTE